MKNICSVISLSVLVLFLLVSNVNGSSDWVQYGKNKDGDVGFYKKVGIISNKVIRVYDKTVYSEKGRKEIIKSLKEKGLLTKESKKISVITYLKEINCMEMKVRGLSVIWYDKNGNVLLNNDLNDSDSNWTNVIPDSRDYSLGDNVCGNQ